MTVKRHHKVEVSLNRGTLLVIVVQELACVVRDIYTWSFFRVQ
jgi:hypothetical protein